MIFCVKLSQDVSLLRLKLFHAVPRFPPIFAPPPPTVGPLYLKHINRSFRFLLGGGPLSPSFVLSRWKGFKKRTTLVFSRHAEALGAEPSWSASVKTSQNNRLDRRAVLTGRSRLECVALPPNAESVGMRRKAKRREDQKARNQKRPTNRRRSGGCCIMLVWDLGEMQ